MKEMMRYFGVPSGGTVIEQLKQLSSAERQQLADKINATRWVNVPQVKKIIRSDAATVVLWEDGTRTVVKCKPDEPYDPYYGFCAALAKKVYGSSTKARKVAGIPKEKPIKRKKSDLSERTVVFYPQEEIHGSGATEGYVFKQTYSGTGGTAVLRWADNMAQSAGERLIEQLREKKHAQSR